jgi:hypothetical protein
MNCKVLRRKPDGTERVIEEWGNPLSAQRAALVLTAYELKKGGRDTFSFAVHDFVSSEIIFTNDLTKLDLPQWALDVLLGTREVSMSCK